MEAQNIPGFGRAPRYHRTLERARARAKRIEDHWRESAFLPVNDSINGVTVRQMTFEKFLVLVRLRNPFVYFGETPQPEHVGEFLWHLSPQYHTEEFHELDRRDFVQALVIAYTPERFQLFYRAIYNYVWVRCWMDSPTTQKDAPGLPVSASIAGVVCHALAKRGYSWTPTQILQTPIAAVFQLMKCVARDEAPNVPHIPPLQARVTAKWMERNL